MRVKKSSKKRAQPVNVVITGSGELDPNLPFWKAKDVIRFVFTTKKGLKRAQEAAQDRAFVVALGEEKVNLKEVLKRLKSSGLKNILVEGGGELMAQFLQERLLQELYVTLTPWILGGRQNPSLVGGVGLDQWAALKLLKARKVKEEIYFHYKVKRFERI